MTDSHLASENIVAISLPLALDYLIWEAAYFLS